MTQGKLVMQLLGFVVLWDAVNTSLRLRVVFFLIKLIVLYEVHQQEKGN